MLGDAARREGGLRGLDALPAEDPLVRSGALLLLLLLLRRVHAQLHLAVYGLVVNVSGRARGSSGAVHHPLHRLGGHRRPAHRRRVRVSPHGRVIQSLREGSRRREEGGRETVRRR